MNNLLSMDDFADVLDALESMPQVEKEEAPMTEEELASMRRYEEIIRKHNHKDM
ncbi:MAG: hypothetical protein IJB96_09090 [Lachnospira sp.]|nr:hypothetical protein [Lachnospira sp.]